MFNKSDVKDIYALSPMQEGMLFHALMNENSSAYFEQLSYRIIGEIDHKLIETAFNRLIERYDPLRTVFVYKLSAKPRQVVLKVRKATVYGEDISHLAEAEKVSYLETFKRKDRERGFDLSTDILIRFSILKLSAGHYEVIWSFHHIIMDGWCTPILIKEMLTIYEGLKRGENIPLSPVTPYAAYIKWLEAQDREGSLEYWEKYLGDYETPAGIITPRRKSADGFVPGEYRFTLGKDCTAELERLSMANKVTLNITFQALWGLLIQKYNNVHDVVYGIVVAGRPAEIPGIEEMLGLFINTVPLRVRRKPGEGLRALLKSIYSDMSNSRNHDYLSLAEIQAGTLLKGDLLNHIVVFENYPIDKELETINKIEGFGLSVLEVDFFSQTNYDITVVVVPGDQLSVKIKYNAAVYERCWLEKIGDQLRRIARQLTLGNDISAADMAHIEILSEADKELLLVEFNNTQREYPADKTIDRLFEEQVQRTPGHIALASRQKQLKYSRLNEDAAGLACVLRAKGIARGGIVAIMADPAIEMLTGILAVLKAGGIFLPMDPTFPPDRVRYMLADSGAKLILTQAHLADRMPLEIEKLIIDDRISHRDNRAPLAHAATSSDPLYIIYTSGTTGKSKGVLLKNQNLVNYVEWFKKAGELSAEDRTVLTSSFAFDLGYTSLFPCILNGGLLHLVHRDVYQSAADLLEYLEKNKITYLKMTPSLFAAIVEHPDFPMGKCLSLRLVLLGGEAIKLKDVEQAHRVYPHIRFMNHYGPTEATIGVVAQYIDFANFQRYRERPTIGKPIHNAGVCILDRETKLMPLGIPGELCVFGAGIAGGYLNSPERTAEKFNHDLWDLPDNHDETNKSFGKSRNPFSKGFLATGGILYRTGDLARWLPDGHIEFLGRIDHQVKVRGYRVELGEIENRLAAHPGLGDAVVTVTADEWGDNRLCAYIVGADENVRPPGLPELREFLGKTLPDYMIPGFFIPLAKIPLTANGKVNKAMLPRPEPGAGSAAGTEYLAPRTEKERLLAGIWSEILNVEKIGISDNFIDLGGHSLKAMSIISRVNKEFGGRLPLSAIFENPTISQLSGVLFEKRDESIANFEKCPPAKYYHLSHAQKRLWFFNQMAPGNPAYNESRLIHFTGDLDSRVFEQSFKMLVERHEALRTSITVVAEKSVDGEEEFPVQVIHEDVEFKLRREDISGLPGGEREAGLRSLMEEEGRWPFDLARAPLLRVTLIQTGPGEHVMVIIIHHIVSDAWSVNIMIREFAYFYDLLVNDRKGPNSPAGLRPLAYHYKDFAHWQNRLLAENRLNRQKEYWHREIGEPRTVLNLYTDYPRPALQSFAGDSVTLNIDSQLTARLRSFSRQEVATLFMILVAAFKTLLHRWSGQEDIIIGTLIAGRSNHLWEDILGYFINILVLRETVTGEMRLEELLKNLKKTMLDAYDNQDYPFDKLVDELKVERNLGRAPLFDVMTVFQNYQDLRLDSAVESLDYRMIAKDYVISKYDLYLDIFEMPDQLQIVFEYCTALFQKESIERMAGHYLNMLTRIVEYPRQLISRVEIMSEDERRKILNDFNNTGAAYPKNKRVEEFFQDHVAAVPHRTAILEAGTRSGEKDENAVLANPPAHTYQELAIQARKLAAALAKRSIGRGAIVGVMIERSLAMMVGIYGILTAGAAYLPIDPALPKERREFMLKDSGAKLLLTPRSSVDDRLVGGPGGVCAVMDPAEVDINEMDLGIAATHKTKSAADMIYVIYTSGSTGKPKGVMIAHSAVVNRLLWMEKCYPLGPGGRILQKTSIAFDVSVWELFWWAMQGASLCLLGPGDEKKPEAIVRAVENHKVTVMHFVPSMLSVFLEYIEQDIDLNKLESLKEVFASGEALAVNHVEKFKLLLPTLRLINLYGPTEATVDVSYYECSASAKHGSIPIGKPIDNIKLYIIDQYLQPQPLGIPGELCISGDGLARGYLNRPGLTADKFIPHPFITGERMYKTGDLARWLNDGNVEFLGRIDHQVKIRGYRIELGEIENRLSKHSDVKEALVTVREDDAIGKYLCAYFVPEQGTTLMSADLKIYLSKELPDYMIPSYFIRLEKIPLTPNGKVDRKILPEPNAEEMVEKDKFVAPITKTEKKIAEIWSNIIKIDKISIHDNFFEIGGHSLLIPKVFKKLNKMFPSKLQIADLFDYHTIQKIAMHIDGGNVGDEEIIELDIG